MFSILCFEGREVYIYSIVLAKPKLCNWDDMGSRHEKEKSVNVQVILRCRLFSSTFHTVGVSIGLDLVFAKHSFNFVQRPLLDY